MAIHMAESEKKVTFSTTPTAMAACIVFTSARTLLSKAAAALTACIEEMQSSRLCRALDASEFASFLRVLRHVAALEA